MFSFRDHYLHLKRDNDDPFSRANISHSFNYREHSDRFLTSPEHTPKVITNQSALHASYDEILGNHMQRKREKYQKFMRPKGTFNYQQVGITSGRNSSLVPLTNQRSKKYSFNTEPSEEADSVFDSIEGNLSECDKILLKLKGIATIPKFQKVENV